MIWVVNEQWNIIHFVFNLYKNRWKYYFQTFESAVTIEIPDNAVVVKTEDGIDMVCSNLYILGCVM